MSVNKGSVCDYVDRSFLTEGSPMKLRPGGKLGGFLNNYHS